MKKNLITFANRQDGSVLIISLIMLVVMTLLGVTAMRTSVLEEKMSGNMRERELAFQAAEATLRAAEKYIENSIISTVAFDTTGTDGLYNMDKDEIWKQINWDANDSLKYTAFGSSYNILKPPRYVIQHYASTGNENDRTNLDNSGQGTGGGKIEAFLITVRATGGADKAAVYLQSTWGKRL